MSFSSTPLGQGRRLDHHTFLNKPNPSNNRAPSRGATNDLRRTIPTSYAYGAPSLGTRSPPKPNRPLQTDQSQAQANEAEETALVRFARLKQRDQQQQQSRPDTIRSPHPEKWSVKDTSVNIAGAFYQAASTSADTSDHMNPNQTWASGAQRTTNVPRSTSVEYEKETQSTVNRRLAPPPNRLAASRVTRPVSKSASFRHVPDSEGEEDPDTSRGKTPIESAINFTKQLFSKPAILMRESSREPEDHSHTNGNGSMREQSSYDYSQEERDFQETSGQRRKSTTVHKRNRMSTDNKAYRPSMSDLEESDEDFEEENGKRTKRKKKKTGGAGGPLTTLPVAGYDKRKRRKKGAPKENGAAGDEEEEESSEEEQASEQRSHRGATPLQRAPSVSRGSVPPSSRLSAPPSRASVPPPNYDSSYADTSLDVENALGPIQELEEEPPFFDGAVPRRTQASYSVGATIGRGVNLVVRVISALLWWVGRLFRRFSFAPLAKYALVGLSIYSAWYALNHGALESLPFPTRSAHRPYNAPDIPITDLNVFSERLRVLEKAFASLSAEADRQSQTGADVAGRVVSLETKFQRETARAQEAESKHRATTNDGMTALKQEFVQLSAQLQAQAQRITEAQNRPQDHGPVAGSDEEARAKLKALEERVGTVEGGVKDALEMGKNAVKVGGPGSAASWWNKLASGTSSGLTIKSTDGQDVTSLLNHLVNSAVMRHSKDTLARADYALHSAGARIIPSLTSDVLEVAPPTLRGKIVGFFDGSGYAIGRPPVTVLHHEIHPGQCWPFAGSQGQVGIALAAPVYISHVTIDHVAKELALDLRSAPRQMELWGLVEGAENAAKIREWRQRREEERRVDAEARGEAYVEEAEPYPRTLPRNVEYVRVASFAYDVHAEEHIQTFPVREEIRELGIDFGVVVLIVNSNWGKDELTCLYRLRVHGERMGEVALPAAEEAAAAA